MICEDIKRYPVYASHVWEVIAVLACIAPYADRRRAEHKNEKLDKWLVDFVEHLELLACYMTKGVNSDGLVYLRKSDRELIEKISNWVKVNNVMTEGGKINV